MPSERVPSRGLTTAVLVAVLLAAAVVQVPGVAGAVGPSSPSSARAGSPPLAGSVVDSTAGPDTDRGPFEALLADGPFRSPVAPSGNNTTSTPVPHHRNPENRSTEGNLSDYQRWLAGRMGQVLVDCSRDAAARRFGACDLDEEYPEWLDKYVEVARETDRQSDDNATDAFAEAKETQQTFNDEVARFWRTYRDYRRARDRGNTERARRLARRLRRTGTDVNETAVGLVGNYRQITGATTVDLGGAVASVRTVRENVTSTAEEVVEEAFVATNLSVRGNATDVSFLSPLAVSGRLTTENGSAVGSRTVTIAIEGRTRETTTDENGQFEVIYRPMTLPLDSDRVTVRYVPANASAYGSARSSVPVSVEQVEPTVTVERRPETVGFGDTVFVTGSVGAGGIAARGVPVRVGVAGGRDGVRSTKTVRTDSTGGYRVHVTVPATVPEGDRRIVATIPLDGRALAGANATVPITISTTNTSLAIDGTDGGTTSGDSADDSDADTGGDIDGDTGGDVDGETGAGVDGEAGAGVDGETDAGAGGETASGTGPGSFRITGRLTTVDGQAVGGQPVRLRIDGHTLGTVRTGPDGRYATTASVPDHLAPESGSSVRVRISARFDATGTNLEPVNNSTIVRISKQLGGAGDGQHPMIDEVLDELASWTPGQWLIAGGVLLMVLGLLGLLGLSRLEVPGVLGRPASTLAALTVGRLREAADGSAESNAASDPAESDAGRGSGADDGGGDGPPGPESVQVSPLQRAREYLDREDTDRAVETAYAVARDQIDVGGEGTPPTHWEFYTRASDRMDEEHGQLLQWLTRAYEMAAFAPTGVGDDAAKAAIEVAERLQDEVGATPQDRPGGSGEPDGTAGESTDD